MGTDMSPGPSHRGAVPSAALSRLFSVTHNVSILFCVMVSWLSLWPFSLVTSAESLHPRAPHYTVILWLHTGEGCSLVNMWTRPCHQCRPAVNKRELKGNRSEIPTCCRTMRIAGGRVSVSWKDSTVIMIFLSFILYLFPLVIRNWWWWWWLWWWWHGLVFIGCHIHMVSSCLHPIWTW